MTWLSGFGCGYAFMGVVYLVAVFVVMWRDRRARAAGAITEKTGAASDAFHEDWVWQLRNGGYANDR